MMRLARPPIFARNVRTKWTSRPRTGTPPAAVLHFSLLLSLLVSTPLVSSLAASASSSSSSSSRRNNNMQRDKDASSPPGAGTKTSGATPPPSSSGGDESMMTCDYLVVGAGAMGLAFVDSLLILQPTATVILVDKKAAPGGHWNDDYDYVKLHQPSLVYGVESSQLEGNWLATLLLRRQIPFKHRATKGEILTYYRAVVDKYVATGQLRYVPHATYDLEQTPEAALDGADIHSFTTTSPPEPMSRDGGDDKKAPSASAAPTRHRVEVKVLVVDAVQGEVKIPATTPPAFAVEDPSLRVITPNELHQMHQKQEREQDNARPPWFDVSSWLRRAGNCIPFAASATPATEAASHGASGSGQTRYVVLGCGKTGMDTVVYLKTELKVPVEHISWVVPRDVWVINRSRGSPNEYHQELLEQAGNHEATMDALEAKNIMYRLDPDVRPTAPFRFPTVSTDEIKLLRSIHNKVRRGRVSSISVTDDPQHHPRLRFEDGTDLVLNEGTVADTVFVHCTSPGPFNGRHVDSIYTEDERRLVLFSLLPPPIPLSGAMLARIETSRRNGTVDLSLGRALLSADVGNDDTVSGASMWRQLIRPYFTGTTDSKAHVDVHWNLAAFLALLDKDPAVGAHWLSKGNRLSIYSWIQKLRSYENVRLLVEQAAAIGYSKDDVRAMELLAKKLEPLQGR